MSTGAIIAIIAAVIVIIALLAVVVPRMRRQARLREIQEGHRRRADEQAHIADEQQRRATLAQAEAERARADAGVAQAKAEMHRSRAEADPADLRGRDEDELRAGLGKDADFRRNVHDREPEPGDDPARSIPSERDLGREGNGVQGDGRELVREREITTEDRIRER